MTAALFVGLGALAGLLHAVSLGRSAGRATSPLSFVLRLGGVGGALVAAALAGHPLAAAGGWALAFPVSAFVVYRRLPR